MASILRSRRCSARLLVASATTTNQKYAPVLAPAIDAQPLAVEPTLEPPTQPSSTFIQITPYTIHPIQPLPPTLPIVPPKVNKYIYAKTLNKDGSQ